MKLRVLMVIISTIISLSSLILIVNNPVYAQDDEIIRLRQRISELEKRIYDLENLLKLYNEPEKIRTEAPGWQNKKNWRKLKDGMSKEQVQSILGEPIKTIDGVRTLWYYPNIYCGYVSFDEKGRVTGWDEP